VLGKTVTEVADAWAPYLTMTEGIRIAAKAFTTDVSKLSCCACARTRAGDRWSCSIPRSVLRG
ncbi:MAG: hypothetical protein WBA05_14285, partial [Gordonia sp. (in: high G+C Gram-positive bacteria)]|uniref:hypothetical protein n=1 Tax=Gordonia sp. (in: high G+C Gram-positive bacteria) TaxID=84139 RepID=UPI003C77B5FF